MQKLAEIDGRINVEDEKKEMHVEELEAGTEENMLTERGAGVTPRTGSARMMVEEKSGKGDFESATHGINSVN